MLMIKKNEQGSVSIVLAIGFGLLFVVTSAFGIWAYTERQSYKNDVDAKIDDAVAVAVQAESTRKDAEFVEKEKSPVRSYTGPEVYGNLTFDYPKTWSVYVDENSSGTVLDFYAYPKILPEFNSGLPYALRVKIVAGDYDDQVAAINTRVDKGLMTSSAFRPEKNDSVLGIKGDGNLGEDREGSVVLLPLRDRTISFVTESQEFVNDFNKYVLPSINYQP